MSVEWEIKDSQFTLFSKSNIILRFFAHFVNRLIVLYISSVSRVYFMSTQCFLAIQFLCTSLSTIVFNSPSGFIWTPPLAGYLLLWSFSSNLSYLTKLLFIQWCYNIITGRMETLFNYFMFLMSTFKLLSHVWLSATPCTVAYRAPLSIGFSWQGYWNGSPFPSPVDVPDPGIESSSPTLQANTLPFNTLLPWLGRVSWSNIISTLHSITTKYQKLYISWLLFGST